MSRTKTKVDHSRYKDSGSKAYRLARERRKQLLDTYGITAGQYEAMLRRQGGVCAICGKPPKTKALNVDHDHKTETVRGLLCMQCNKNLVGRHHDGVLLRKAADYVESGFDGRLIEPVAVDGTADETWGPLRVRVLKFREQSVERLAAYAVEPGIDVVKMTKLPSAQFRRGPDLSAGRTLIIFTEEQWLKLRDALPFDWEIGLPRKVEGDGQEPGIERER